MKPSLIKYVFLMSFLLNCLSIYAEDHGGGGEKPKEGEHGGGEKAAPAGPPVKTVQQEINELQAKVSMLRAKVAGKESTVKKLIEEKAHAKTEKQAYEIVEQLKIEYKDLQAAAKEYDQQRALLLYRYPERGRTETKKYERINIKDLEVMEMETSAQGTSKKSLKKIRAAYGTKSKINENSPTEQQSASQQNDSKSKNPATDTGAGINEPIIIEK